MGAAASTDKSHRRSAPSKSTGTPQKAPSPRRHTQPSKSDTPATGNSPKISAQAPQGRVEPKQITVPPVKSVAFPEEEDLPRRKEVSIFEAADLSEEEDEDEGMNVSSVSDAGAGSGEGQR